MLRNLLYNCCPILGSEQTTRDNIACLCKYPNTFNHKKIINVKIGIDCEAPEFIKPLFTLLNPVEFRLYPNNPALGETIGFIEGFEALYSLNPDEITYYAHTKGVSPGRRVPSQVYQECQRQWRNRMYYECLSRPEKIDLIMRNHAACGCWLRHTPAHLPAWFAGAFFWVNHAKLFMHPGWKNTTNLGTAEFGPQYLAEKYVGELFIEKDMCDLYSTDIRFYYEALATFNCKKCGIFDLVVEKTSNEIQCPKCGGGDVTFVSFPEMF